VALPRRGGWELGQGLHLGLQELADEFSVAVAGGDTNTWDGPLVISVTVLGEATGSGPVRRSGAKVGDWIMATGSFGGSIAGKHLDFTPRVAEALALHQAVALHGMLDVSDGLAADLGHILEESHVGAILDAAHIPISTAATPPFKGGDVIDSPPSEGGAGGVTPHTSRSPGRVVSDATRLTRALGDGEDFELLFTVSSADGQKLLAEPPFSTPLAHIGEIVAGQNCLLRGFEGTLAPLVLTGWKHGFEKHL
jgi:thiamine-monophosphate kinase